LHLKEDIVLVFPAFKTRHNGRVFTFCMKWLCYSCVGVFAAAKWFITMWLVLRKLPTQFCCAMQQSYPNVPMLPFHCMLPLVSYLC